MRQRDRLTDKVIRDDVWLQGFLVATVFATVAGVGQLGNPVWMPISFFFMAVVFLGLALYRYRRGLQRLGVR